MFLPLSAEGKLDRLPWAVIAIMAINVAAYVLVWPAEKAAWRTSSQARHELLEVELGVEQVYLGGATPEHPVIGAVPSSLRGRSAAERFFWERFENGQVVPEEHEHFVAWREASTRYRRAREAQPYYRWGMHPENRNPLAFLTSMFLHFGLLHLAGNMLFLWISGASVENVWGWQFFLLIYLSAGMLAVVRDAFFGEPLDVVSAGASGAVAGMMGAFLVRHFRKRIRFLLLPMVPTVMLPGWALISAWALLELRGALGGEFTGVAHWVHVSGFAAGALIALGLRHGGVDRAARRQLERSDARIAERKRQRLAERAALKASHGDLPGQIADLEDGCRRDPGAHEDFALVIELLALGGQRERAASLGREVLATLWAAKRRDEHGHAFRILEQRAIAPLLPALDRLHAAEVRAAGDARGAAQVLYELVRDSPEDPLVRVALQRYADLLDRLDDAAGAAAARTQAAARRLTD